MAPENLKNPGTIEHNRTEHDRIRNPDNKSGRTLGIIGGLGPETSCSVCLNINNKFFACTSRQPGIVLSNLSIPPLLEKEMICGNKPAGMFSLIKKSVEQLENAGVHCIIIPCNTVHVFIDALRRSSSVPILSIIEETLRAIHTSCRVSTVDKVRANGRDRAAGAVSACKTQIPHKSHIPDTGTLGLLATSATVKSRIYHEPLEHAGFTLLEPPPRVQKTIDQIILRIIHHRHRQDAPADRRFITRAISSFRERGAQAVIFGCTDLSLLGQFSKPALPLLDSTAILEDAAVAWLLQG